MTNRKRWRARLAARGVAHVHIRRIAWHYRRGYLALHPDGYLINITDAALHSVKHLGWFVLHTAGAE